MVSTSGNGWDFRSYCAVLMAIVAIVGALTAYQAARAADDVSAATRLLDEAQILALNRRQFYLDNVARADVYAGRSDSLRAEAVALTASALRVGAQEDLAASRLSDRYARYYQWNLPHYSLEGELERWTARDLGQLGFNVTWREQYGSSNVQPDIWADEEGEIGNLGMDFTMLAAAVVLFVLALLFLTLADLAPARRRKGWLGAGILCAVVASILVLVRLHAAVTIAFALLGYVAVGALAVKLYRMAGEQPSPESEGRAECDVPAAELGPTDYIGSRVFSRATHGGFSRAIVIAIAFTALFSACCAYLYSYAAARMYEASSAAVGDQATAFRESTRNRAVANAAIDAVAHVQEDQARADATAQAVQLENEGLLGVAPATLTQENALRRMIYRRDLGQLAAEKSFGVLNLLFSNEGTSVLQDARFPDRLLEDEAILSSDRAFAIWDAHNQLSTAYQGQMSRYLWCLTLFAIALYLFGLCMGIEGFVATRVLSATAALLALFGVLATLLVLSAPAVAAARGIPRNVPPQPHECADVIRSYEGASRDPAYLAAERYACGLQLERLASRPSDYLAAASQFELALEYRPGFALAEFEQAASLERASSPQGSADFESLPGPDSNQLSRRVDEERRAVEELRAQHFDNPRLSANLGFDLFLRGVLTSNRGDIDQAARLIDESIASYGRYADAEGWDLMNQALLSAARGRLAEATARYAALAANRNQITTPEMALGGMTDLEFLSGQCSKVLDAATCSQLTAQVPQWKAQIAVAVGDWELPATVPGSPGNANVRVQYAQVTPGGAAWIARALPHRAGEKLLAIWYQLNPTWNVWVALPQLQEFPAQLDRDGFAVSAVPALVGSDFGSCLDAGRYRVEFYLQGRPAGVWTGSNPLANFAPNFDPRLNLAVCSPPGWRRDDGHTQPGIVAMTYSPGRSDGFVLIRRDYPGPIDTSASDRVAARELAILSGAPVQAPSDPLPCAASTEWHQTWYQTRGRSVLVENRMDFDGEIYEGFFFAGGSRPDADQCAVASSFTEFERRTPAGAAAIESTQGPPARAAIVSSWTNSVAGFAGRSTVPGQRAYGERSASSRGYGSRRAYSHGRVGAAPSEHFAKPHRQVPYETKPPVRERRKHNPPRPPG
jgi:hypothetical protein